MRSKEEANDYRYFPDPDLLPLVIETEDIEDIKQQMPELPNAKKLRFMEQFSLKEYDAYLLTSSIELADYYEKVKTQVNDAKLIANWLIGELSGALNKNNLDVKQSPISADQLSELLKRIEDKTISGKIAKKVFESIWNGEGNADEIIEKQGLKQITDTGALEKMVDEIIANNSKQVEQYKNGQTKLLGYFVGQAMKASKGKGNPQELNKIIKAKLDSL